MNVWTVVLLAGLGSYLLRLSMIGADRLRLPARLDESLMLAAPAAFAAIAMSSLAGTVLTAGLPGAAAPIVAVAVAVLAVLGTDKGYAAVLAGMPTYWLVTALTSR